jgi:hypothetical protein
MRSQSEGDGVGAVGFGGNGSVAGSAVSAAGRAFGGALEGAVLGVSANEIRAAVTRALSGQSRVASKYVLARSPITTTYESPRSDTLAVTAGPLGV